MLKKKLHLAHKPEKKTKKKCVAAYYVDWLLIFQNVFLPLGILNTGPVYKQIKSTRATYILTKSMMAMVNSNWILTLYYLLGVLIIWIFAPKWDFTYVRTDIVYTLGVKAFTIFIEGKCKDFFLFSYLFEMFVHPLREGFLLNGITFICKRKGK